MYDSYNGRMCDSGSYKSCLIVVEFMSIDSGKLCMIVIVVECMIMTVCILLSGVSPA